jgi:hypothetical protein
MYAAGTIDENRHFFKNGLPVKAGFSYSSPASQSISGKFFSITPSTPAVNFSIAIRSIGRTVYAGE